MALHTLVKIVRHKKRVGRGIGSRGAKSGRGMKGQKARAGSHSKAGFEGGQTPLYMRLPKNRGSKQKFPSQVIKPMALQVHQLDRFAANSVVGPGLLRKAGLLDHRQQRVKLIGNKAVTNKYTVRVHAITAAARASIEKKGGKVELIRE